jgi:hypothetical protein
MKERDKLLRDQAKQAVAAPNADSFQARICATPRLLMKRVGTLMKEQRSPLRVVLVLIGVVGLMTAALLFDRMRVAAPTGSLKEFLAANPDCAEATNQCRTCVIFNTSETSCSVIGIACQPQNWSCRELGRSKVSVMRRPH